MRIINFKTVNILLSLLGFSQISVASTYFIEAAKNELPPPQLIAISFDGSKSIDMWDSTVKMAKNNNSHFTYFISGVYFITQSNKNIYQGPYRNPGKSDIGFGSDENDLNKRVTRMQSAVTEGNEIGSHVNGHYDGGQWTYEDWQSEFKQFHQFVEEVFSINKMQPIKGFDEKSWGAQIRALIKGFRAPLLAINENSDKVLSEFRYTYDASRTAELGKWPYKLTTTDTWQFPLGYIPIVGTAKKSIAMDFNFYYFDSKGLDDAVNSETYSDRYYESLMNYFNKSYNGRRAPLNIGNHFSKWNAGAYYNALEKFVKTVCNNQNTPDVHCVNYSDLVEEMNSMQNQYPNVLAQWIKQNKVNNVENNFSAIMDLTMTYDLEIDQIIIDPNNHEALSFELFGDSVSKFYRELSASSLQKTGTTVSFKVWPLDLSKKEKLKVSIPQSEKEVLSTNSLKLKFKKISNNRIRSTFNYKTAIRHLGIGDGAYTFSIVLHEHQNLKKVEIQSATRDIKIEKGRITEIEDQNQENRAREAELPGAHMGEE